jgi:NADPH-dependent curcumin reductase CurA
MSTLQNRQFKLISRPVGGVKRDDFEFATVPTGEPGPGEVLVRVQYISIDPAMRAWMNEVASYVPPVGLGEVMRAIGLGRVVASNDPSLAVGDTVTGMTGVQDYFIARAGELTRVDPRLAPLPRFLGALRCGAISQYNTTGTPQGPAYYMSLLVHRARMEGFLVFDYAPRYGEALKEMAGWIAEGKLKAREDIVEGLETFPETLLKLFDGENLGKLMIKVSDDSD